MSQRYTVIMLAIMAVMFFATAGFALPQDKMNINELTYFNSLVEKQTTQIARNQSIEGPLAPLTESPAISEEKVLVLVSGISESTLNEALAGRGTYTKLSGDSFQINSSPSVALEIVTREDVTDFGINDNQPLLRYSNATLLPTQFYSRDLNGIGSSICIVDTGIRTTHLAFTGKDFNNMSCGTVTGGSDPNGHGTHVAGIATMNNFTDGTYFYKGVAYGNKYIINATGFDENGSGSCLYTHLEECFLGQTTPANVSNNSWGSTNDNCSDGSAISNGNSTSTKYIDYLADVYEKVIVFAAGNSGPGSTGCAGIDTNTLSTPGDGYNVITVASMYTIDTNIRSDDTITVTSSRGPTWDNRKKPDIIAPGRWITSDYNTSDSALATMSGTSMAAPHVTGAAALIIKAFNTNWLQTKAILLNSAEDVNTPGWDKYSGWGYLDLNKAYYEGNNSIYTLAPGSIDNWILYTTRLDANDKVTMVWERHCSSTSSCSSLSNLDLSLYDTNDVKVSDSNSTIDNVEQVKAPTNGIYQIGVDMRNTSSDENIAFTATKSIFLSNSKVGSISKSNTTGIYGQQMFVDINVQNDIAMQRDFNLKLYKDTTQVGDTNSFSLSPLTNSIKRISFTLSEYGDKNFKAVLSAPSYDENTLDNNFSFTWFFDTNSTSISDINVNPANIYSSQSDQNVIIDANVQNIAGPAKDFNASLYINGIYTDSNIITLANGASGRISFTKNISAGTFGDINILLSIPTFPDETNGSDNNVSTTKTIEKIDSNIASVTPSATAAASRIGDTIIFDITTVNNGSASKDINVLLYINNTIRDWNNQTIASGQSAIIKITENIPDYNNALKFSAVPSQYEYNSADNNYLMDFNVMDANGVVIQSIVTTPDSNSLYSSSIDQNLFIDANITNTLGPQKDVNAVLYINGTIVDSNQQTIPIGTSKVVRLRKLINAATAGDINILVTTPIFTGESTTTDNNYAMTVFYQKIDSNIIGFSSSPLSGDANKNLTVTFDVNAANNGNQAADVNVIFYVNSIQVDSNTQNIGAGLSKTYRFTRAFSDANTPILFQSKPSAQEYTSPDNNYSFFFIAKDVNNPRISAMTFRNVFPYPSFSPQRSLTTNSFSIDINVNNNGTSSTQQDVNVRLFDNSTLIDWTAVTNRSGDTNTVTFTKTISTTGTHTILASIAQLNDENSYSDNNSSLTIEIDGNAARIASTLARAASIFG